MFTHSVKLVRAQLAGAAYEPSARRKLDVPPPVVSVTPLTDLLVSASELVRVGITTAPDLILPVPLGFIFMSIFISHPVASSIGQVVVAAFDIVNSLTAVVAFQNFKYSLPHTAS